MNPYDKNDREKGQFDEVLQNIKNNEIYQKINNHDFSAKIKNVTN